MMLERCNQLHHSSRVKLPFVKKSVNWFLDSTYLIWTVGSKLILSKNQSRTTRWVRDACLIVGLLPLMVIFITPSLSSKMCNCAFERTWSMFDRSTFRSNTCFILGVLWVFALIARVHAWVCFGILGDVPNTSITKSHKSSANKPSIRKPASNDMISDYLWSCENLTFASCTSSWSVQMFDFQKCTKLRLMWILRLQDLLQNLNLEITPIDNVDQHCPHDNIGGNHSWNECKKLIVLSSVTCLNPLL